MKNEVAKVIGLFATILIICVICVGMRRGWIFPEIGVVIAYITGLMMGAIYFREE